MIARAKPKHNERVGGRYSRSALCDGCGKPAGTMHGTDTEVCGRGDGPGFVLCDRKRCVALLFEKSAPERLAVYTAMRIDRER